MQGNQNQVLGNYIGTNVAGSAAAANSIGIVVSGSQNTIGGSANNTVAGVGNVISGNKWDGISVSGTNNAIAANIIGMDSTGKIKMGNGGDGIYLTSTASGNTIGGLQGLNTRNAIVNNGSSGNVGQGVKHIYGIYFATGSTANVVEGDYIGLSLTGQAMGNSGDGILVDTGSTNNTIGGTAVTQALAQNIISANGTLNPPGGYGVELYGSGNLLDYNLVGLAPDGKTPMPNSTSWWIDQTNQNTIGNNNKHN